MAFACSIDERICEFIARGNKEAFNIIAEYHMAEIRKIRNYMMEILRDKYFYDVSKLNQAFNEAVICLNIDVNSKVKNMVIFYPVTNALTIDNYESSMGKNLHEESVFGIFMGSNLHNEEVLKMASPINYVHENMPSLWLQHGLNDNLVPYQQSVELIEKVKDLNIKFYYELKEDKVHTDPYFFCDENVKRIIEFIEKE